jgi:NADPH:quinone reductase-like Zn-dependent oxidoreductase
MKAVRYRRYGSPDVLEVTDADPPAIGDHDVLVRVRAASLNPLDRYFMRGRPFVLRLRAGLSRPKTHVLGADMAGEVEAVGSAVTKFRPGDEVFGGLEERGTLAEYISLPEDGAVAAKPAKLSFPEAAGVPVVGYTALQALRDHGQVQAGQRVLVNGASGGVGTFTVQLAKAFGAEVTAVCSTRHMELVASLGADRVIDYTKEDFTTPGPRYDVLLDVAGNRALSECRRVLAPRGILVGVGVPSKGRWIGPLVRPMRMALAGPFVSQTMTFFLARQNAEDLSVLSGFLEAGTVVPVIDRTYPLAEVAEAMRYLERGHAQGKIVVTV